MHLYTYTGINHDLNVILECSKNLNIYSQSISSFLKSWMNEFFWINMQSSEGCTENIVSAFQYIMPIDSTPSIQHNKRRSNCIMGAKFFVFPGSDHAEYKTVTTDFFLFCMHFFRVHSYSWMHPVCDYMWQPQWRFKWLAGSGQSHWKQWKAARYCS